MLFRIVGADVRGMRPLEDLVPLRPLLDDVSRTIDDDEAVFPAGVDAELTVRRRVAPPGFHRRRRVPTRSSVARERRLRVAAPRQAADGELHARSKLWEQRGRNFFEVRQLSACDEIHAIRAFGEDALRRSPGPVRMPGQCADILRPVRHDVVRAEQVLATNLTRHGSKGRTRRSGIRSGARTHHAPPYRDAYHEAGRQRQHGNHCLVHRNPPRQRCWRGVAYVR